jgi:hypothetical protein
LRVEAFLRLDFFVLFYQEKRTREKGIKRGDESLFMNWASFFSLSTTPGTKLKSPPRGFQRFVLGQAKRTGRRTGGG